MKLKNNVATGLFLLFLLTLFTCKKEEPAPEYETKIKLGVTTVDNSSYHNATISTILVSTGGNQITQHGHCWSKDKEPTVEDKHTELGKIDNAVKFTSELDSLLPGEKYYVRPYMTYPLGTAYGDTVILNTMNTGKPLVTTSDVQNITFNSANCGGVVVSDSGSVVTSRGVCWNTTESPTLKDCIAFTIDSSGMGKFDSQISELISGTLYYVRAYAINEVDTAYGNQVTFTTLINIVPPSVTTEPITVYTQTTATSGGIVTDQGNGNVYERGICYSIYENPDLSDPNDSCGSGAGPFECFLTELTPNTKYYARAYAINEVDTAFGNQEWFTTSINIVVPSVTTSIPTNITQTTATSGGNVTSQGGGFVYQRGVCYNTTGSPTYPDDQYTTNGDSAGVFISHLTDLTPYTWYFVRAYAINQVDTAYGVDTYSFRTLFDGTLPTVTTSPVTNITQTTAKTGGNVIDEGGGSVSERGVCYNTTGSPTYPDDPHTNDGSGFGSFESNLTGLSPSITYFVKAYAMNEAGTNYGSQVTFTTDPEGEYIHWDDGINNNAWGQTGGGTFYAAARFTPADLINYDGMYLTSIKFFPTDNSTGYRIMVWTGDDATNLVHQQLVTPNIDEWNNIELTSSILIDASIELWFGYACLNQPAGEYPAGVDIGPAIVTFGDMMSFNGGITWVSLYETYDDNYNWNIQGQVVESLKSKGNNQGTYKILRTNSQKKH